MTTHRHSERLLALLPHRPPMLLIDELISVAVDSSAAQVSIRSESTFFQAGKGVPAEVGIEYMGQTAALIAGHQLELGMTLPHLGFLLGSRRYNTCVPWFEPGDLLTIRCLEKQVLGNQLATFQCDIDSSLLARSVASAVLTVYRQPLASDTSGEATSDNG